MYKQQQIFHFDIENKTFPVTLTLVHLTQTFREKCMDDPMLSFIWVYLAGWWRTEINGGGLLGSNAREGEIRLERSRFKKEKSICSCLADGILRFPQVLQNIISLQI